MVYARRMSLREIDSKMRRLDEAEGKTRPARSMYAHILRETMTGERLFPSTREEARTKLEGLLRDAFAAF